MFNGNTEILKCNIKNIFLEHLIKIVRNIIRKVIIIILLTTYNNTVKDLEWFYESEGNKKKIRPLENLISVWRNKYIITVFELLLTPPNIPIKYLFNTVLIAVMLRNTSNKSLLSVWEYKFESV